jgi:hypothetical protein
MQSLAVVTEPHGGADAGQLGSMHVAGAASTALQAMKLGSPGVHDGQ